MLSASHKTKGVSPEMKIPRYFPWLAQLSNPFLAFSGGTLNAHPNSQLRFLSVWHSFLALSLKDDPDMLQSRMAGLFETYSYQ